MENGFTVANKAFTYLLDIASGTTFLGAIVTGNQILMILGGLASICAIINHADQFLKRNKK